MAREVFEAKPRWLLKTPPHIAFLVCAARSGFSDHVDARQVADEEARHFADPLQRGLDYRERMSDESARFFDVYFRDILADPIATIERMYQHFGFDLSPEARDAMVTYLEQRPSEKHGLHRYNLEQFGLSRQRHGGLFTGYCQRFGL
ncbi:MAG: sulfotransferase [Rhodocyclaceae bacterium]|nr:sulfotransferase [Rhodocyclaceae bacterium]MBK6552811.1 sulfotransferase [Rhodocyclaceae bacterium]MBK6676304.1 sulfotransferase [Rhodocyclaceae bacterium]MBK9312342.1 sulfotransferase [Rhodocyclaceae bacterium]MBK9955999.1 sulfotransferase [Rhodocyclaceae bacterium]